MWKVMVYGAVNVDNYGEEPKEQSQEIKHHLCWTPSFFKKKLKQIKRHHPIIYLN